MYERLDKECRPVLRVRGAPTIKSHEMLYEAISPARQDAHQRPAAEVHAASQAHATCLQFKRCVDLNGRDGSPEVFHQPSVETRACQDSRAAEPVLAATPQAPIRMEKCLASSGSCFFFPATNSYALGVGRLRGCGCAAAPSKWEGLTFPVIAMRTWAALTAGAMRALLSNLGDHPSINDVSSTAGCKHVGASDARRGCKGACLTGAVW